MYLLYSKLCSTCNCYLPYVDIMNTFAQYHNYTYRVGLKKIRNILYSIMHPAAYALAWGNYMNWISRSVELYPVLPI